MRKLTLSCYTVLMLFFSISTYGLSIINKNSLNGKIIISEKGKQLTITENNVNTDFGVVLDINKFEEQIVLSQKELKEVLKADTKYLLYVAIKRDGSYDVQRIKKEDSDIIPIEIDLTDLEDKILNVKNNEFNWYAQVI